MSKRICTEAGCVKEVVSRHRCANHYQRWHQAQFEPGYRNMTSLHFVPDVTEHPLYRDFSKLVSLYGALAATLLFSVDICNREIGRLAMRLTKLDTGNDSLDEATKRLVEMITAVSTQHSKMTVMVEKYVTPTAREEISGHWRKGEHDEWIKSSAD